MKSISYICFYLGAIFLVLSFTLAVIHAIESIPEAYKSYETLSNRIQQQNTLKFWSIAFFVASGAAAVLSLHKKEF